MLAEIELIFNKFLPLRLLILIAPFNKVHLLLFPLVLPLLASVMKKLLMLLFKLLWKDHNSN